MLMLLFNTQLDRYIEIIITKIVHEKFNSPIQKTILEEKNGRRPKFILG